MQIAPLPVNHAGMRGEDMATTIAWYRPSWAAIRSTDASGSPTRTQRRAGDGRSGRPSSNQSREVEIHAHETEIRPFRAEIPDEAIAGLRRRIAAVGWPSKELVADRSQGVQLATLQELARLPASPRDCNWFGDGLVYHFGACFTVLPLP